MSVIGLNRRSRKRQRWIWEMEWSGMMMETKKQVPEIVHLLHCFDVIDMHQMQQMLIEMLLNIQHLFQLQVSLLL